MEALTVRMHEAKERINDIEDQMMENKEAEKRQTNNHWTTRGEFER